MAARIVSFMASHRARWIVLTPTPYRDAWVSAITDASTAVGLDCFADDISAATANAANSRAVIITDDATFAVASEAQAIVSILTDYAEFDGADPSITPTLGAMSIALAQACSHRGVTRVISQNDVRANHQALSLFDDVTITPPKTRISVTRFNTAPPTAAMLDLYQSGRPTAAGPASEWPATAFNLDGRFTRCDDGKVVFDITGRPRFMVSGPYIVLTPGRWLAKVRFSVDLDACKHRFRFDWGTQAKWFEHSFVPGRPGIFEIELRHDWEQSEACEMRIVLQEGSFSGEFVFYHAKISAE